ncbi:hypothetical protein PAF17_14825 [Paracoccus sp. Z330]|uniref:Uncharacterized protein n=1 Tax=Paracoccus onchidii TaxID=3017813 RepID=A0ABT4ZHE0_9RHOB|nr:hypothetical protein [Paracoccus onchidii]MDB6178769.1 hypothetical protein [Paracoccus onchidii]
MFHKIAMAAMATAFIAACSPKSFESAPVTVETAQGPVICQLYTKSLGDWDRSVSRPEGMSLETADQVCVAEGQREMKS